MDGWFEPMPACVYVIVMHGWRSWEHGLGLPVRNLGFLVADSWVLAVECLSVGVWRLL